MEDFLIRFMLDIGAGVVCAPSERASERESGKRTLCERVGGVCLFVSGEWNVCLGTKVQRKVWKRDVLKVGSGSMLFCESGLLLVCAKHMLHSKVGCDFEMEVSLL
jgi:hypothetical protein